MRADGAIGGEFVMQEERMDTRHCQHQIQIRNSGEKVRDRNTFVPESEMLFSLISIRAMLLV